MDGGSRTTGGVRRRRSERSEPGRRFTRAPPTSPSGSCAPGVTGQAGSPAVEWAPPAGRGSAGPAERCTRGPRCPRSSPESADRGATRSRSPAAGSSDQERPRTRITPDRALRPVETSRLIQCPTLTRGDNSSTRPTCQVIRRHRQRREPRLLHQSSSDERTVTTTREERCRRPRHITDSNDHPHRHQTPSAPWEAAGRPDARAIAGSTSQDAAPVKRVAGPAEIWHHLSFIRHEGGPRGAVTRRPPPSAVGPVQGRLVGPQRCGEGHRWRPGQRKRARQGLRAAGRRGGGADCAGRRRGGNLAGAWPLARRSRAETSCGAGVDDPRKATRAGLGRPHRSVAKRVGTQGWKGHFRQAARHTVPLRRQCRGTLMKAVRRWYPSRNGRSRNGRGGSRPRAMSAGERAMSLPGSAPSRTPGTTGGCPRRPRHRSARGCRPSRVTRNALRSSEDHAMSAHPPHRARPGHEHGRRKP